MVYRTTGYVFNDQQNDYDTAASGEETLSVVDTDMTNVTENSFVQDGITFTYYPEGNLTKEEQEYKCLILIMEVFQRY